MGKIISLKAYNQNFTKKKINLLSLNNEKHTGILSFSESDEELKEHLDSLKDSDKLYFLRIQMNKLTDFIFNGFYVNGIKRMYMDYFSLYQFQTSILDINLSSFPNFNKLESLEAEICENSNAYFTFFKKEEEQNIDNSNSELKELLLINPVNLGITTDGFTVFNTKESKQICIILDNKSEKIKEINLLDVNFENGFEDDDIKIEVPINEFNGSIIKSKIIRYFSNKSEQISNIIKLDDGEVNQGNFFTANQFQSIGVDMPLKLDIGFGVKFEISLLPKSKVMYMFYGE